LNLPISLNETVDASDITGRNACPIWLRISALMQAIPFEADVVRAVPRDIREKGTLVSMTSRKHRSKPLSYAVWCYFGKGLYEFPSISAFLRKLLHRPEGSVGGAVRARLNNKIRTLFLVGETSFTYKGHILYLKNPRPEIVPIVYLGG
jgi:hypothetical protein